MSDARDKLLMQRETVKHEKKIATVEAMRNNIRKGLANALKDERRRQAIAREAYDATRNNYVDDRLKRTMEAGGSLNRGYDSEDEIITGFEELPWSSDDFDPFE